MIRLLAFVWLVLTGTNVVAYYSEHAAFQGILVVLGAACFLPRSHLHLHRLLSSGEYLLTLSIFVVPVLLMFASDRAFERGAYTSAISVTIVFVVSSVLALRAEFTRTLVLAAFVIVAIGATVNGYELFVENNVWSIAPGRSAGFYVNPNVSGQALVGFGLIFFVSRANRPDLADLLLALLVAVGVAATFSRAAILAAVVLFALAAAIRGHGKRLPLVIAGAAAAAFLVAVFASFVEQSVDLSRDASARLSSLSDRGGIGDYQTDRGAAALNAIELAVRHPLLGTGVGTIYELDEGPHNMFVAMMLDYGVVGLIAYVGVLVWLLMIGRRARRDVSGGVVLFVGWLILFSFASHNLLGDMATIPLFGFALARAYQIQASWSLQQLRPKIAR